MEGDDLRGIVSIGDLVKTTIEEQAVHHRPAGAVHPFLIQPGSRLAVTCAEPENCVIARPPTAVPPTPWSPSTIAAVPSVPSESLNRSTWCRRRCSLRRPNSIRRLSLTRRLNSHVARPRGVRTCPMPRCPVGSAPRQQRRRRQCAAHPGHPPLYPACSRAPRPTRLRPLSPGRAGPPGTMTTERGRPE